MDLFSVILIFVTIVLYLYWNLKRSYSYFDKRHFPTLKPTILLGNMGDAFMLRKSLALTYYDLHKKLEPHAFGGLFLFYKPFVILRDAELIRNVLIKDFHHFRDRCLSFQEDAEPILNNLLRMNGIIGERWKNLRVKLTPMFTTGKMKMMFPLVEQCALKILPLLDNMLDGDFNACDLCARYTTDVIGSCAFGVETNALENPKSQFREMGKRIFEFRYQALIRRLYPNLPKKIVDFFNLRILNSELDRFFMNLVKDTVRYREENGVTRYDFLDILIALKNQTQAYHDHMDDEEVEKFLTEIGDKNAKDNIEMTVELMAAQCLFFFGAGFETTATSLGFLLLELAQNKTIQTKVRDEIIQILSNSDGKLTYDDLRQMTYTDMVISEALRKHPPAGVLFRKCTKPYPISNSKAVIPAGMPIFISIYGVHMDPRYYEKPDEFYPEHFTEQAISKRPACAFIPFGDGPRTCIAARFAKIVVKIALVYLMKDYSYDVSPKMTFPLKYEYQLNLALMIIKGGVWLRCKKI